MWRIQRPETLEEASLPRCVIGWRPHASRETSVSMRNSDLSPCLREYKLLISCAWRMCILTSDPKEWIANGWLL